MKVTCWKILIIRYLVHSAFIKIIFKINGSFFILIFKKIYIKKKCKNLKIKKIITFLFLIYLIKNIDNLFI